MNRAQLAHLIRAAADIADDDEIIVIGSQAILAEHPDAPPELLYSMEADLFPRNHPERAEVIDGSIGELSPFHQTFGYYAQGVSERTATLPEGWEDRLVPIRGAETRGATGWCLEKHDLVVSKLIAGRAKDLDYARVALEAGIVSASTLRARLALTGAPDALRAGAEARLAALAPAPA